MKRQTHTIEENKMILGIKKKNFHSEHSSDFLCNLYFNDDERKSG